MATISLTIPNEKIDRILTAFDYTPDQGTKTDFMRREIINIIKSKVAMAETAKIEVIPPTVDVSDLGMS